MTLDELRALIQSAQWFANLGRAVSAPGLITITDIGLWQEFGAACTSAEFDLPHDASVFENPSFAGMNWLPTALEEPDPIHGGDLEHIAHDLQREDQIKETRVEVLRLALKSQQIAADQPILIIGPTNFNDTARMAGRYASRRAASEIVAERVGFWCRVVKLYNRGHWPLGLLPSGEVVVL
jgi:hypothetical protein